ncbi:MAG: HD domain-containing protein [Spirochaetes bacterium]|nr:HD domain-containing protein [Spirochaetota bacterium]
MRKIRVDELKPGMVFDKAVYIDMNNILVAPMVPLKKEDIDRLVKWGIEEVETAGVMIKQEEEPSSKRESLKDKVSKLTEMMESGSEEEEGVLFPGSIEDLFDELVSMIEDVFEKIRNGVGYDKEMIIDVIDRLIEKVKEDKNKALTVAAAEQEGKYIYALAASVSILAVVTGISLEYGKHRLIPLGVGALLHDIGMVRIPSYIIEKKGTLSDDEYNRIKTHPIYGYRIITKELELTNEIATIALQHHEAYDGTGYPRKSKGEGISEFAKIVSICDVYAAMTRKRSYRDEHLSYNAMKNVLSESNRMFDPNIVKAFLSNMAIHPIGSIVQLNNNVIGMVVSANPELPLRPRIEVLVDEFGDRIKGEKFLDLQELADLYITKPLSKAYLKQKFNE